MQDAYINNNEVKNTVLMSKNSLYSLLFVQNMESMKCKMIFHDNEVNMWQSELPLL